jgi:3-methyladenine DNA glycosylase Tag
MTTEQVFEIIGANPENALTDEQKAMVRYLESRGFEFLSEFFVFDLTAAYWDIFEIEITGSFIQ